MNMRKKGNHILLVVLSAMLMGMAIDLLLLCNLGADAITTLEDGLAKTFQVNVASVNTMFNLSLILLVFVMRKTVISVGSFLFPLVCSVSMKLNLLWLPHTSLLAWQLLYLFAGILLMCIAIGLNTQCSCGSNPYDALCLSIGVVTKLKYAVIRLILDMLLLFTGILLHGSYGIGTILCVFTIGVIANQFITLFQHCSWLQKVLNWGESHDKL